MNLPVLDVAIGISFVFLLLSLICTTVNEMLAGVRKSRAKFLDMGIARLLGGNAEIKKLIYEHPMIQSLASDSTICPSYIPANKFVTVALDLISGKGNAANDMAAVRAGIKNIPNEHLQVILTTIMDKAHDEPARVQYLLEQWFDENMDRVTGWYKKHTQVWAIILASIMTIVINADALHMAALLWTTPTVRAAMVEQAKVRADKALADSSKPLPAALTPDEKAELAQLTGWESDRKAFESWKANAGTGKAPWDIVLDHLLGWILTAIAVSMGAPFWFDTLNRFMNIRNAGRSPDEKRDKTSSAPSPANP
ncbi:MAG: hypothetical protein ABI806_17905 [Candidatus Solibacter sp.]